MSNLIPQASTRRQALRATAALLAVPAIAGGTAATLGGCADAEAGVAAGLASLSTPNVAAVVKGIALAAELAVDVTLPTAAAAINSGITAMEAAVTSGSALTAYEAILSLLQIAAPYITATPNSAALVAQTAQTAPAASAAP